MVDLLKYAEDETEKRGRNKPPINVRQDVYDFWKANSNVSVHRSNDSDLVTISGDNFESSNIHDEDIDGKVQGHRLVATKPYRRFHEIYCQVSEFQPSFGLFINLKPFYVSSPTNKETEMRLCSKCLNPHCIYKAIKNSVKGIELLHSLTEFLCTNFVCPRNQNINYYDKDCIEGKCANNCKPIDIMSYLHDKLLTANTMVSYYVFENVFMKYFNKHRKEVEHKRTARVDKREPLLDCISKLQELTVPYLLLQFSICCDTVYWKEFLSQTSHYVL